MRAICHALILSLSLLPTSRAIAQAVTAPDTTRAQQTLFTARDAWLALGFTGLTVAMFPLDRHMRSHLRDQTAGGSRFVDEAAKRLEYITTPGSFIIGGSLYVVGAATKHRGIQDLGWHGTEAVLMGSTITNLLKGVLGRARPDVEPDMRPSDFQLGEGFRTNNRQSFPSGHTTTAFAAAAAVTSEVHRMWPKYTWYVGPALYAGATLVGVSRMYHNRHWASDVALGAGIGTFSGLKVVRYSHAHPDNLIDRIMLRTSVAPDGRGGAYIIVTAPAPR
jgi:membrane-associated phospholipid phosphatase